MAGVHRETLPLIKCAVVEDEDVARLIRSMRLNARLLGLPGDWGGFGTRSLKMIKRAIIYKLQLVLVSFLSRTLSHHGFITQH